MIGLLVVAAALAPAAQTPGLKAIGGLAGCWNAPGTVRGKGATSVARGTWHLGGRYFVLQLRSIAPKQPYEAAITYGAGEKPQEIGSFWMDTFGGLYGPSLGLGAVTPGGFSLDYRFPDSVYTNGFERKGKGWTWTIMEKATGKPEKLFARYELMPTSCRGMRFNF
ncbi:MAG TPA: hypothetical protein VK485_07280 [Sphingomicrobium sp.]|nr:hypothetical protein [Sphingomicrobium sp.]